MIKKYRTYCMVVAVCMALPLLARASGKILSLAIAGGVADVRVDTSIGGRYQLQCCYSLPVGDWVDVGESFIADAAITVLPAAISQSCGMFRVVKVLPSELSDPGDPPPPPPPPPPNPFR
jgi:hypothetical protein